MLRAATTNDYEYRLQSYPCRDVHPAPATTAAVALPVCEDSTWQQHFETSARKPVFGSELNLTMMTASVAIGAAGAVDPTIAGYRVPAGIVSGRITGAGTFSLVYPIAPNATILVFVESSAAGTVIDATLTAKSTTAGTASITVHQCVPGRRHEPRIR